VLAVSAPVRGSTVGKISLTKCAYLKHGLVPTQLDRGLTKLQLPFPNFNYAYRLGRQNIPSFGTENRTATSFFVENLKKNGRKRGEVETRDDFTLVTGLAPR